MGRPNKTNSVLRTLTKKYEPKTPIATEMFLPNHSGITDHPEMKYGFLKIDGSNANTTVDIGSYNFRTGNNIIDSSGFTIDGNTSWVTDGNELTTINAYKITFENSEFKVNSTDIILNGTIDINGNADISGALTVTDDSTFSGELEILNDLNIGGSAAIDNDLTVGGIITVGSMPISNPVADSNIVVGYLAGNGILTGAIHNILLGKQAGYKLTVNDYNIMLGSYAALYNTASNNIAIGYSALRGVDGSSTGTKNIAIGVTAGYDLTTGSYNTLIATSAGGDITDGNYNTYIGYTAGRKATGDSNVGIGRGALYGLSGGASGDYNLAIGTLAGYKFTTGQKNLLLGYRAGFEVTTGQKNNFMGYYAGATTTTGSGNILIGDNAYASSATASDELNIGDLIKGILTSGSESVNLTATTTVNGRVLKEGTFGEIHVHDNTTTQSIPTGVTYTKLTAYTDNGQSSNMTPDATNNKITITKTGRYLVNCSLNFSDGTNNVEWKAAPFLNGVEQDHIHIVRKIGTAGDVGSASMTGIIDVTTANWDLDIRARHDNGGSINITIEYSNLNVSYLGET